MGRKASSSQKRIRKKKSVKPDARPDSIKKISSMLPEAALLNMLEDFEIAKKELEFERNRVYDYLDVAGVIIVAVDTKGKVGFINRKGSELLGKDKDEIIGKHWVNSFVPKKWRKDAKTISEELLSGRHDAASCFENPIIDKDGEARLIAWTGVAIKDSAGNITGHLSSGEDITELLHAEDSIKAEAALTQQVMDLLPHRLDVVDEDFRIVRMNRVLIKTFGKKSIGKKCYELYRDKKIRCPDCPLKKGLDVGETKSFIVGGIDNGRTFRITHKGLLLPSGKKAVLEIFEDISAIVLGRSDRA